MLYSGYSLTIYFIYSSSVQFSHSVVSDSLWPHGLQHARLPCPSPTPRVHPNSCPSSWWCHPAISFFVVPFSSCPQSLPASESFPMSNIPGSYAILLFTALDLASITSPSHNWVLFLLWLHPFTLSGVISPLISSSILGTYQPGEFLFQYPMILPFCPR